LKDWEFLLIDNGSRERLSDNWDLSWHLRGRHVRENELGLTAARLRGIKESSGEVLVFVDDDNLLARDYLKKAVTILKEYPHLGVFGAGILEPEFELQPPRELLPWLNLLALRQVSSVLWSNNPKDWKCIPWGAGLCVTRRVADFYPKLVERLNVSMVLDRRGQELFCGGDDLFSWASVRLSLGFGLFPELRVTHLIEGKRLNLKYFVRLVHGHSFSNGVLHYLVAGVRPRHIDMSRCLRLVLRGIKHGLLPMRLQWAALCGEDRAARLIAEKEVRTTLGVWERQVEEMKNEAS
jgi:glycosyltransferase involved in cell wall biosynthesis